MPPEDMKQQPYVRLESLCIGYRTGRHGQRIVAEGIDATLPEGQLTCLIGRNGTGKSTLLRTVASLQPMLRGKIFIGGDDSATLSQKDMARKLAALYGIPVEDILDDYTLFLHRGGGDFLRRYREAKGWSRQQLADHAKVSRTSIRCWESGQKTISQKCFCHLVENLGSDFPSMLRM